MTHRTSRAHVTSEWATGRITVQVTHQAGGGRTVAYVADPFTKDGVPRLEAVYVAHTETGLEHKSDERGRAPGISFTEDDAVLIWEALDEYLHNTGTHPTKALQAAQEAQREAEHALEVAQAQAAGTDALAASQSGHLFALQETLDRERAQHDATRKRLEFLESPRILQVGETNPVTIGPEGITIPSATSRNCRCVTVPAFDSEAQRNLDADVAAFREGRAPASSLFCGHLSNPGIGGDFQPPRRCTKRPHDEGHHAEDGGYRWDEHGDPVA